MPPLPYLRPARRPVKPAIAIAATLAAGTAALLLPAGHESASVWALLAGLFPESARSCLALGWASFTGGLAYLAADAAGRRRALRPACTAALVMALLSPVALAAPLWAALLVAAGLLACPAPPRLRAANDNPAPERPAAQPFSLAA